MTTSVDKNLLALDVGSKRIGVALVSLITKLPKPLTTIDAESDSIAQIQELVDQEDISAIIIGLPRNLSGEDTEQTKTVRDYGHKVEVATKLPIYWQDEALTSQKAEEELRSRGVGYNKEHVDALAATYILSDFLSEQREAELQWDM